MAGADNPDTMGGLRWKVDARFLTHSREIQFECTTITSPRMRAKPPKTATARETKPVSSRRFICRVARLMAGAGITTENGVQ